MRGTASALLLVCAACRPLPAERERPSTWRLVEIDAEGGPVLVFERIAVRPRLEVRVSRDRAGVGEIVEAEIRLPDAAGVHRLEVRPGRPGIRILGPRSFDVRPGGTVRVRFTCETAGRAGIVVEVVDGDP